MELEQVQVTFLRIFYPIFHTTSEPLILSVECILGCIKNVLLLDEVMLKVTAMINLKHCYLYHTKGFLLSRTFLLSQ